MACRVRQFNVVSIRVPRLMNCVTGVFSQISARRWRCASSSGPSSVTTRRTYCTPSRSACSSVCTVMRAAGPRLALHVHAQRRGRALREPGQHELVWRRPAIPAAFARRFVAGQRMRAGLQLDDVVGRVGIEDGVGVDEGHGKSPVADRGKRAPCGGAQPPAYRRARALACRAATCRRYRRCCARARRCVRAPTDARDRCRATRASTRAAGTA